MQNRKLLLGPTASPARASLALSQCASLAKGESRSSSTGSKQALGHLRAIRLEWLAVETPLAYAEMVHRLATDATFRLETRRTICDRVDTLFDATQAAAEWANFLLRV